MPGYEAELPRFQSYDTQVLGISVDSHHSNRSWAQSLGGISYPLLADFEPKGEVARAYGVYRPGAGGGHSERAIFVVDKQGVIRYIDVHDIDEQPDDEQIFEVLRKL